MIDLLRYVKTILAVSPKVDIALTFETWADVNDDEYNEDGDITRVM